MSYRRRGAFAPPGPRLGAVAPNTLPLSTVPPFVVTYTGEFDPALAYEADIVSVDGQWTVTESVVVQDETTLVATFNEAPDGAAGLGYTQIKDLAADEFGSSVPFSWTASELREQPARAKARAKPKKP